MNALKKIAATTLASILLFSNINAEARPYLRGTQTCNRIEFFQQDDPNAQFFYIFDLVPEHSDVYVKSPLFRWYRGDDKVSLDIEGNFAAGSIPTRADPQAVLGEMTLYAFEEDGVFWAKHKVFKGDSVNGVHTYGTLLPMESVRPFVRMLTVRLYLPSTAFNNHRCVKLKIRNRDGDPTP